MFKEKRYVYTFKILLRNTKSFKILYQSNLEYTDEAIDEIFSKEILYANINNKFNRYKPIAIKVFEIVSIEVM